jgi:hypothetical protein
MHILGIMEESLGNIVKRFHSLRPASIPEDSHR